jgi:hypothetical protein
LINEYLNQNEKINTFTSCFLTVSFANAQDRVITTVPFIVSADGAAGMEHRSPLRQMLFATMEPGKYAFATDKQGVSISYTPYLTNLANDISLGQLTYYNKISERSAFAGSLRYFGFGEMNYVKLEANEHFEPYLQMNLQLTVHTLKIKRNILHGSSRKIHPFKLKSH